MFDLEKVKKLNDLEMIVYQFILENSDQVANSTIRQLSSDCHVSTSTILRFCGKLGFEGFSEFKYALKKEHKIVDTLENYYEAIIHVDSFMKKMSDKSSVQAIDPAVELIAEARHVVFSGIGTSGTLGDYGSRYFANLGINAYSMLDPFSPVPVRGLENTLAIILSVSGETKEMVKQVTDFKKYGAKVLSITNNEFSTVARLADHNLSYYMPEEHSAFFDAAINLTTQVPVIVLLEILAHRVNRKLSITD
ncbi:MurR/RpiR family transcriptional regulator [Vagococcus sp. BWB3-3]|uniref:MurR/RpiR family transcriptional regulator n=1 Tax=Vagococcus allomyrinae TaxID=2794353 RepID=A0A940PE13_9ENTE|nr:MurR/RpiR family transcriptional regulator [Vagococcus allomyrinae]MBP1041766.1 MurR/RpiR family transcriptional regulator [Vagococcus allomyrinae]